MNEEPSGIEDRSMCSHGLGDGAAEISDQFSGFISDQVEENQLDENRNICFNDLEMEIVNEESPGIEDRSMCSHGLGDRAAEISDQFSGSISDQVEENQLDEDVSICSNEEDLEMKKKKHGGEEVGYRLLPNISYFG